MHLVYMQILHHPDATLGSASKTASIAVHLKDLSKQPSAAITLCSLQKTPKTNKAFRWQTLRRTSY